MKVKYIRKMRAKALNKSAKLLDRLASREGLYYNRFFYIVYKFFWEIISPSEVYRVISADNYATMQDTLPMIVRHNRIGYAAEAYISGRKSIYSLEEIPLPDVKLYKFSNVYLHHGSDFIIDKKNRLAVNDYCALKIDPNQGYEDSATFFQTGMVAILKKTKVSDSIERGIMINGKFSYNYYHNLYENLIRLFVVEDCNETIPSDVPIIVDEDVYQIASIKRIFEILSSQLNREVVILKKNEMRNVKTLYSISSINKLVPVLFDLTKGRIDDCIFDKEYIQRLREKLLLRKEKGTYPKRFFITRKNSKHRNFNEDDVYEVLKPYGFERIAPEELSFEQQMALFNGAEWIIGGPGAAFANLLFCSSCNAVCLYEETPYIPAVFSAPAYFNNSKLVYFLSGKEKKNLTSHTHNFIVDIEKLKIFIKENIPSTIN